MILVTGASGNTGSEVVKQLAAKGVKVRALVRNRDKAKALVGPNVEIVVGDLAKPETLAPALEGIEKAYLVSSGDPTIPTLHGNFINAAKRAGVKHIVRLSALGADLNAPINLGRWHGETQRLLEQSGVAWTHIQPHFFMQNLLGFAQSIKSDGAFYAPLNDAKISMVDTRDIAAVVAAVLTSPGHEGKSYVITGPSAVSYADVAETLSKVIGKPVKYVNVTPEDAHQAMLGAGMPEWFAGDLIGLYAFFSTGNAAFVTDVVKQVAASKGHTFQDFARDYAAAFGADVSAATHETRRKAS